METKKLIEKRIQLYTLIESEVSSSTMDLINELIDVEIELELESNR